MELTLQAFIAGEWRRAALLEFTEPDKGPAGACNFEYDFDFLTSWIGRDVPLSAVSLRLPLSFGPVCGRRWPSFLDDIRPLGSARRWWLRHLNLRGGMEDELELLRRGTVAPVGNLRIEEALPPKEGEPTRFARQAVIDRESDFLEYAAGVGAQVGGATGAGGDAPKLLVRVNGSQQVWIDTWQDQPLNPDGHYLVKFARGRTERDRLVLRSEFVFYRALAALGVESISVEGLSLEEGEGGPSLWLPRFDVGRENGREVRYGLESVYSLVGGAPGAYLTHQQVLSALREVLTDEQWGRARVEYLERELLNQLFGNTDNHGRNTALLKTGTEVRLAPLYDFAPMKMDPEGVSRTTRWQHFESGGRVDWPALLESFGPDQGELREALRSLAERLRGLPDLLKALGLPEETLRFPGIDFFGTERKLREWTLL